MYQDTIFKLTNEQIAQLKLHKDSGLYAEGYQYLNSLVRSQLASTQNSQIKSELKILSNWLENAAHINANDGSFKSEFVRTVIKSEMKSLNNEILTESYFQEVSDGLAKSILGNIIDNKGMLTAEFIIDQDVKIAVQMFHLPAWAWAGTLGDMLPVVMGGLGNDFMSVSGENSSAYFSNLYTALKANLDGLGCVIGNGTKEKFDLAQRFVFLRDPLILDLDGDGLETIPFNENRPIYFDLDADGLKTGTGWVSPDDGFLVLDRNGNGIIDDGTELFGDATPLKKGKKASDGFAALAAEDTNRDGHVNFADKNWQNLRVWRDLNQDGISQTDELFTLGSLGIYELDVKKTKNSQVLKNGNEIADLGGYKLRGGASRQMGIVGRMADINLVDDTFHREFPNKITVSSDISVLPDMQGSGRVRDLQEAASLSPELKEILAQYAVAPTRVAQQALLPDLLNAWANTSDLKKTLQERVGPQYNITYLSLGNTPISADNIAAWESKLHVVEAFNGRYFSQTPNDSSGAFSANNISSGPENSIKVMYSQDRIDWLNQSYDALRESVYKVLAMQTRFAPIMNKIELKISMNGIHCDFSKLEKHFQMLVQSNPKVAVSDLVEFNRFTHDLFKGESWRGNEIMGNVLRSLPLTPELLEVYKDLDVIAVDNTNTYLMGTDRDEVYVTSDSGTVVMAYAGNDVLFGGNGNDNLQAGFGDDFVYGGAGADSVFGGEGDDVIYGGNGNDWLMGEGGNDYIKGGLGDDFLQGNAGSDTYVFGRGDGADTLSQHGTLSSDVDVLQFESGIVPEQLWFKRFIYDLEISIIGTNDHVTITNWFGDENMHVEQIKTQNGKTLDHQAVEKLVQAMAAFNPPAMGQTTLPQNYQAALSSVLAANWK